MNEAIEFVAAMWVIMTISGGIIAMEFDEWLFRKPRSGELRARYALRHYFAFLTSSIYIVILTLKYAVKAIQWHIGRYE